MLYKDLTLDSLIRNLQPILLKMKVISVTNAQKVLTF